MQNHDYTIHLFVTKLENLLIDPIMEHFLDIANDIRTNKYENGNLKQFQLCLREIKEWGRNGQDEKQLEEIMRKKNCAEYFQKLLQGIFQHHIEDILRKRGKDPEQSLRVFQIPKAKNFVHKVYLEFAKNVLWPKPQYIFDITKRGLLRDELRKIIKNVIHDFIPFEKLLDESYVPPKPDAIDIKELDHDSLNDLLASLPPIRPPGLAPNPAPAPAPAPLVVPEKKIENEKKKVSSLFASFADNDFLGGLGGGNKEVSDGKLF